MLKIASVSLFVLLASGAAANFGRRKGVRSYMCMCVIVCGHKTLCLRKINHKMCFFFALFAKQQHFFFQRGAKDEPSLLYKFCSCKNIAPVLQYYKAQTSWCSRCQHMLNEILRKP